MEIFIKLSSREYERLRSRIPDRSPARAPIKRATRIDYSLEGVLFEGYTLPCNEHDARIFLEIARECCPEIVPKIQEAMRLAESQS